MIHFVVQFTLLVFLALLGPANQASGQSKPKLLGTTGMVTDILKRLVGEGAEIRGLMGEGIDPHLYKAAPSDVRLLQEASAIFYNGLHLEGKLAEILEKLARKKPVIAVADGIPKDRLLAPPAFEGNFDPHIWFDVSLWMTSVEHTAKELKRLFPERAAVVERKLEEYLEELRALHIWCKDQIASIPKERRVLVTAHDAFGYFGTAYDVEVIGIQGISTDSEASLKHIQDLVSLLVTRRVPAVFVESSVPRKTVQALVEGAASHGYALKIGGELFSDAMGREGTSEGTYPGMIRHNVNTIVTALK